ncbi:MAG: hypothetical protein JNM89_09380 [Hyphomicrobiaceae bacterium]|nr:hypothetical protein [Hyphomicrobiaceae bacterium]
MRLLGSLVLLTGGLSAAAYAYIPVASFNEDNLAKLIRIQSPAGREAVKAGTQNASDAQRQRNFAPSSPLFSLAVSDAETPAAASPATGVGSAHVATAPSSAGPGRSAWRPIVTTENAAPRVASDYAAQVDLARDLQRELKRVGCYDGDADGDWKTASRRAMSEFLARVNASLPVDRPDYILLTLLQGHADRACGVSSGVVAHAPTAAPRGIVPVTPPAPAPLDRATRAVAEHAPRTPPRAAAAAAEPPPAQAASTHIPPARIAPASVAVEHHAQREPLPGRMAIGAPVPPPPAPAPAIAPAPRLATPPGDDAWSSRVVRDHAAPARATHSYDRPSRAARPAYAYKPAKRRKFTLKDALNQMVGL